VHEGVFYRDARSMDKYSIAVVTKEGINLQEDEKLEGQSWKCKFILLTGEFSIFPCSLLTAKFSC